MHRSHGRSVLVALVLAMGLQLTVDAQDKSARVRNIELGSRPQFLIDDMEVGALKNRLAACANRRPRTTKASIGHRGAAMQFPEHTWESYVAAARQGAGIVECDVVFTKDAELVCRHAQDDLATSTNILVTDLADTCIEPFAPATFDADGTVSTPASATCRTSEITLAEYRTLRGKMDGFNQSARTPEEALAGTADWRTDLYSGPTSGTLLTHAESIDLFKSLGVGMTPELKRPAVDMSVPFPSDRGAFSYDDLRQKLIDEYEAADVPPRDVWVQSFERPDIDYWIANEPMFGQQAVFLDGAGSPADLPNRAALASYKAAGINIVGSPLFSLLDLDGGRNVVPSDYARDARAVGLDIIAWTIERSGILGDGDGGFYYQTVDGPGGSIDREGDVYEVLDVMFGDVEILGVFSDWPATVTYYANCFGF